MVSNTRRQLLKSAGVGVGLSSALAGCIGDTLGTGQAGSEDLSVDLAVPVASNNDINWWYGVREIARNEFDLDSEATIMQGGRDIMLQATLSGQVEAFRESPTSIMQLIEQGKEITYFGLDNAGTSYGLMGRPGFETLEDIVEKDAKIGMASSITGLSGFQCVATLLAAGVIDSADEVADQFVQIGYSSDRLVALENGDIDVSPQFYVQWLEAEQEHPDWNWIVNFGDVLEDWGTYGWIALPETIEENRDDFIAMLKGITLANQEISNDMELYIELVNKYMTNPPGRDVLEVNWDNFVNMNYWKTPLTTPEATTDFMGEVMVQLDMLDEKLPHDQIVDNSLAEEAADEVL